MHWTRLLLALALVSTAPAGLASEEPTDEIELTVTAHDQDCPDDQTFCYQIVDGSLDAIEPGSEVTLLFENRGEVKHELMVRTLGGTQIAPQPADENDTDHGDARAGHDEEPEAGEHGEDTNTSDETGEHGNETADHDEAETNGTDDGDGHGDHAGAEENSTGHDEAEANRTHSGENETGSMEAHGGEHADHLVAPGATRTLTFTVPENAEGIYLWCSLPGHEEQGMNEQAIFHAQAADTEATEPASIPAIPVMLGLTALGGTAVLAWTGRRA